jgi:hypothetical protein
MTDKDKRDYRRERELAKRRGETGVGSDSGDATRHRARRAYEKKHGDLPESVHIDHKQPLKKGGTNAKGNLRTRNAKDNFSAGGKLGNRKAKGTRKP